MKKLFPKAPKPTAEELNLERQQRDELASQKGEMGLRKAFLRQGGRRSLISGSERGV
jgi:hypothetical protein